MSTHTASRLGARTLGTIAALVGCGSVGVWAPRALGVETVEFRIVQDTSTAIAQFDATHLTANLVVQARVVGGQSLGGFTFDVAIPGELDNQGTLARLRIQDATGAYYTGAPTTSSAGGTHVGMAYQYFSVAALNPIFNGLINTSGGGFTNSSSQEIGSIIGEAAGATMLATPGMDPNLEGNVSSWPGYGSGSVPANGTQVGVGSAIGAAYFGTGQFVDVYRFRYTISNMSARTMVILVRNVSARTFSLWRYSAGTWAALDSAVPASSITITGLTLQVNGTPGTCCAQTGACQSVLAGLCASGSAWTPGGTCTPNPCPQPGTCCTTFNACSFIPQPSCTASGSIWHLGGACSPQPCTGACCTSSGGCSVSPKWLCTQGVFLSNGTCTFDGFNPTCPGVQACCTNLPCVVVSPLYCAGLTGVGVCEPGECASGRCCNTAGCRVTLKVACGEYTFTPGSTCTPGCGAPLLGACCVGANCSITTQPACTSAGGWTWYPWNSACVVDTCWISTSTGTCCTLNGSCGITVAAQCSGQWGPNMSCGLPPCSSASGACCAGATCSVIPIASCTSLNMQFAGAGTSCNAPGVSNSPCCLANFNQAGGLAVQDIFDFINRWFAGDATARFGSDGSPGVLSVQNIFDFLNAWFAGC